MPLSLKEIDRLWHKYVQKANAKYKKRLDRARSLMSEAREQYGSDLDKARVKLGFKPAPRPGNKNGR